MLFSEISELELMVAGRPRGLLRGGRFQVLSAPVLSSDMVFGVVSLFDGYFFTHFKNEANRIDVSFFSMLFTADFLMEDEGESMLELVVVVEFEL